MTSKQKEIKRIEREIEKLKNELEIIKALPDSFEDEKLENIEDFPFKEKTRINYLNLHGIYTARDLIFSSKSKFSRIRSFGPKSIELLEQWMEKHDLKFLGD